MIMTRKLAHNNIAGRLSGGIEPLGSVGPKASGLADMMASFVAAPVQTVDRAMGGIEPPQNNISSIVPHSGM